MVVCCCQVTTIERFLRYHIQCCESFRQVKLPACSAAAGRPILTQTIILDMSGLSPTRHLTLTVQRFLHTLSQIDSVSSRLIERGRGRLCRVTAHCYSSPQAIVVTLRTVPSSGWSYRI